MAYPKDELKKELWARDFTIERLAIEFDRSLSYISARMRYQKPWTVTEAYKILNLIEQPPEAFTKFFPPNPKIYKKYA